MIEALTLAVFLLYFTIDARLQRMEKARRILEEMRQRHTQ